MAFITSFPLGKSAQSSSCITASDFVQRSNSLSSSCRCRDAVAVGSSPLTMSSSPSPMDRRKFLLSSSVSLLSLTLAPSIARADRTAVGVRRSYDRYHPRILGVVETIRTMGDAVSKNDAETVAQLAGEKLFYIKGRSAFDIYASSFSDNYVTTTSRAMKQDVDVMFDELTLAAKGGEEMADHYQKALVRLNRYYILARLPRSELSGLTVDIPEQLQI